MRVAAIRVEKDDRYRLDTVADELPCSISHGVDVERLEFATQIVKSAGYPDRVASPNERIRLRPLKVVHRSVGNVGPADEEHVAESLVRDDPCAHAAPL